MAAAEAQGARGSMEDRHQLHLTSDGAWAAIFDGHGGAGAADIAAAAAAQLLPNLSPGDALRRLAELTAEENSGACAVAFRLHSDRLEVANLGDCELALVRPNSVEVLTRVHRLSDPEERQRVLAAGAAIEGPYVVDPITGDGVMPTRVLGDQPYHHLGVSSEPHERATQFAEGWLIAACDGLWDVLNPAELPLLLGGSPEDAVRALLKLALHERRSGDNVTVIALHKQPLRLAR
ncbi:MAG: protein phosphatase 2C domain-containing protein [Candidatus Dormibacteraeota bacterium]|nr:protein phosphatase 2C domain-containing protein [Candidatus Dormibacteraeota bacterium]